MSNAYSDSCECELCRLVRERTAERDAAVAAKEAAEALVKTETERANNWAWRFHEQEEKTAAIDSRLAQNQDVHGQTVDAICKQREQWRQRAEAAEAELATYKPKVVNVPTCWTQPFVPSEAEPTDEELIVQAGELGRKVAQEAFDSMKKAEPCETEAGEPLVDGLTFDDWIGNTAWGNSDAVRVVQLKSIVREQVSFLRAELAKAREERDGWAVKFGEMQSRVFKATAALRGCEKKTEGQGAEEG